MNESTTKTRLDYSYFFLMREKAREKKKKIKRKKEIFPTICLCNNVC